MFARLFSSSDNCVIATQKLLKSLKVGVYAGTIEDKILSHPDHPSLLSISDALKSWKVPHEAVKITSRGLSGLTTPFLAQIHEHNQPYFVVVNGLTGKQADIFDQLGKRKRIPIDEFSNKWTRIVLLAESGEQSGDSDYRPQQKEGRLTAALVSLFFLALLAWLIGIIIAGVQSGLSPMSISFYFFLKLSGIIFAALLLWHEIDQFNPFLQSICKAGKKTNCDAVLFSRGAGLAGISSWSELGFAYFTGTLLALSISVLSPAMLTAVSWLSLAAVPYIIYSLLYQAFRVKQWCLLCLCVQAVLIAEAATVLITQYHIGPISYAVLPLLLTVFLLPLAVWRLTKPLLEKVKSVQSYKQQHARLKYNPQIFENLLRKETPLKVPTTGLGITLGNPKAPYHVIKVCNPYCEPCAEAHPVLDELIDNGNIQLQLIFTATVNKNDPQLYPVRHLMAIASKGEVELLRQALDDWYNAIKKNYDMFSAKYPMNGELEQQTQRIEAMHKWCEDTKITHTPTLFINGYYLPNEYGVNDLKNIFMRQ